MQGNIGMSVGVQGYSAQTVEPSKKMKQQADRALSIGFEFHELANRVGALRHRMGTQYFSDCPCEEAPSDLAKGEIPEEYLPRMEHALNELSHEAERLRARLNELESVG